VSHPKTVQTPGTTEVLRVFGAAVRHLGHIVGERATMGQSPFLRALIKGISLPRHASVSLRGVKNLTVVATTIRRFGRRRVDNHLMGHAVGLSRGIEQVFREIGDDHDIARGVRPDRHRPHDLIEIEWVDVGIDNDHEFGIAEAVRRRSIQRTRTSDDYIQMSTAFAPSKGDAPIFRKFLKDVFQNDKRLIHNFLLYLGYSIAGTNKQEIFIIWDGEGGNGKGTLCKLMAHIFKDYTAVGNNKLLEPTGNLHPTSIAKLDKKRFTQFSEIEGSAHINAFVKAASGNDSIPARGMRENEYDIPIHGPLNIMANLKPVFDAGSMSMRRRMRVVPFDVKFEGRQDIGLLDKLKSESEVIMNILLSYACHYYRRHHVGSRVIALCPAVKRATRNYLDDADHLARWLEECCDFDISIKWDGEVSDEYFMSGKGSDLTYTLFPSYIKFCKEII
jgi:P4 family phage/plasmid primase-like protien